MKSPLNFLQALALVVAGLVAVTGRAPAQQAPVTVDSSSLVVDYSANSLLNGSSISSWTPFSGSNPEVATVANATATAGHTYTDPTVANTDLAFNGRQYVSFVSGGGAFQGMATANDLGLTGATNMSVASVYVASVPPSSTNFDAASAGLADLTGGGNHWFDIEDRTFVVTGDPYLAGYGDDLNSGGSPSDENGVLTFALGTYTVTGTGTATFTLYWAYGLTGAVQTATLHLHSVDTTADNFELGYNAQDFNANANTPTPIELGQGLAWDTALTASDATKEIHDLQFYYAPEPSTCALIGASLLIGVVFLRRRAIS